MVIPKSLYHIVRQRARFRCEYCHYPELLSSAPLSSDPETEAEASLFNPRQQIWSEHFLWSADALKIIGKTPSGRATCNRLDLNDERREEPFIQNARRQWIAGQLHPPKDDPQQEISET